MTTIPNQNKENGKGIPYHELVFIYVCAVGYTKRT